MTTKTKTLESGYCPCACRDCLEIAIGAPGAFCHECEDAGCEGDRECQVTDAYLEECEDNDCAGCPWCDAMARTAAPTAIHAACQHAGFCLLSEGTYHPGDVIPRLLSALSVLAPGALGDLTFPAEALADDGHAYWASLAAESALDALMAALQAHAPAGFVFMAEGHWHRLGFFQAGEGAWL